MSVSTGSVHRSARLGLVQVCAAGVLWGTGGLVVTMAVSYGLLYAGLRTTSGSAATVATLVEPLSAALLAALVLGERLTWPALLGGALILAAVVALRPAEEQPIPA